MTSIAGFIICAVVIFFSGKKLSYYGDLIAEMTGVGKAWIGLVLLASVTSLPELFVGISASAIVRSADLAVGNAVGSCAFNLGILAIMDVFVPLRKPIFASASQNHIMAAAMGIILIDMAGMGIFLSDDVLITPWIGATSILFIVIYFLSIRLLYQLEKRTAAIQTATEVKVNHRSSLKKVITSFGLFSVITVIAALLLPFFADEVAQKLQINETFMGTLFLSASTSLPEIAVSFTAIRMGYIDLCVGNLLGSNLFNVFTLAIDDLVYTKGHLLKDASHINLISVLATTIMAAIAIVGLTYRTDSKRFRLAIDAGLIFVVYIINLLLLYNSRI